MVTFILFWTQVAAASAAGSDCPGAAPMPAQLISPGFITGYLSQNAAVNDPAKFLCCLPKELRGSFVVVQNSDAGQSGNPHGPRVLLFPPDRGPGESKLSYVLSINGGGRDLNNPNNVEMLYRNPQTGDLDFYDFAFAGGKITPSRNPQDCINCHGTRGVKTAAGLHANLQPFGMWTRLGGGRQPCPGPELELISTLNDVSQKSMRKNPRFKCLDQNTDVAKDNFRIMTEGLPATGVQELDLRLDNLNSERTARVLRSTPDYARYKYAILGALMCRALGLDDFTGWIPPDQLRKHDDLSHLLPMVADSKDLMGTFAAGVQMRASHQRQLTNMLAQDAIDLRAGRNPHFHLPLERVTCGPKNDRNLIEDPDPPLLSKRLALDRFIVDARVRSPNGLQPELRFLIEGRGISLEDIDMDPIGEYRRTVDEFRVTDELLKFESDTSPLGRIRTETKGPIARTPSEWRMALCPRLKALSADAFKANAQAAPARTGPSAAAR